MSEHSAKRGAAPAAPDGIAAAHVLPGRLGIWRGLVPLTVLVMLLAAALSGLLGGGKDPSVTRSASGTTVTVTGPTRLRSGLFFEYEIAIDARRPIVRPEIAISRGFLRDLTINTTTPEPAEEGYRDGSFTLAYDALAPDDRLVVKLDGQVNPPLFGHNRGVLVLRDGDAELVRLPLALKVLP